MRMRILRNLKLALAAGAAMGPLSVAAPAFAQADEDTATQEIIVSARRRDENLQDVPIAVSAFSGAQLDQIGAADITDLQDVTPNVTLEATRSTNNTLSAFVRGVGQQDPVAGFEAGVGIYLDDVYLNRPQSALLDIYDVERIEILRGPQGTLYGRNTIGGAVKYVTRRLDDEPSLSLRATGGNYGQFDAVATFNLPLLKNSGIGDLRFGGGVAYLTRNGFGENLVQPGVQNYNKDILAARASFEWAPSDRFNVRLAGDWTEDNSDPKQGHRLLPYDFPAGGAVEFPVLTDVFDTRAGLTTPEQKARARGVSNVVEFKASESLTFKNIVAYRQDELTTPIDFDSLPIIDLDVPTRYENHQFSEEFQALYEGERLSGVLGFYYLSANALTQFDVLLGGGATNVFTSSDVDTRTWSVFGDLTYKLTDAISLSFGGRYTEDERSIFLRRQLFFNTGLPGGFALGTVSPSFGGPLRPAGIVQTNLDASANFNDFSPRASIAWRASDEHNLYVSYSQGFKGGSFDPRCVGVTAPNIDGDGVPGALDPDDQRAFCLFQPEDINTYEGGIKSSWADGRYTSNLAVFASGYRNVQIPGSFGFDTNGDGIADTFAGVTTNAAEASLFGIEWEGNLGLARDFLKSGDGLDYRFSLGYIDAQFDEYFGRGSPPPDVTDQARFQNTPKITAYSQLSYSAPFGIAGKEGAINLYASASYRGFTHQFNFETPLDQSAYVLANAGFSWTSDNGRVTVGLHGTNLTDKRYVSAGYDFVTVLPAFGNTALGASGVQTVFFGNPRQFFGTIGVKF